MEVAHFSQSLLAITPYVSGGVRQRRRRQRLRRGRRHLLEAERAVPAHGHVNPDFGQVESDDIVVNFSAIETFFSDKRPFFTENQGFFDFATPSDNSQLLYTRRVGGPADDGKVRATSRGAQAQRQRRRHQLRRVRRRRGRRGRPLIPALRLTRESEVHDFGVMGTQVERPFLDRDATVLGVDHN